MSNALAIIEAESPKRVFRQIAKSPAEFLPQAGFELSAETPGRSTWINAKSDKGCFKVTISTYAEQRKKPSDLPWPTDHWLLELMSWTNDEVLLQRSGVGMGTLLAEVRRLNLSESEDSRRTFKAAVAVPPPPPALLRQAIEAKEKDLAKGNTWTSVHTNPRGQTFCYAGFGRGRAETGATLLYFDLEKREWQWQTDLWHGFLEAESPRRVLKALPHDPWSYKLYQDEGRDAYGVQLLHRNKQVDWHPPFHPDLPEAPKKYAEELGQYWVDWYKKLDLIHPYDPMKEEFHHWYETAYWMNQRKSVGEAEDPKRFLQAKSKDVDERVRNVLRRAHFTLAEQSPRGYERWERPVRIPFNLKATAEVTRFPFNGTFMWDFFVYRGKVINWETGNMTPEQTVHFLKRQYFHPSTGEPHPLETLDAVAEAEDPKAVFRKFSAKSAPSISSGKEVGGARLRTLCSRYPVDGVYIWDNKGPALRPADPVTLPRRYDGVLQIAFHNYGLIRQEWASFGVLAGALLRWRNLEGAALWINGQPRGKVGRRHPQLKEIEDAAYRPQVFGAQAEAEDPKAFLKRLSAKATGKEVSFGFAIHTSDQNYIEEVAREIGIPLAQENWDTLNEDMMAMERNCLEILNQSSIRVREEGHDGSGDLVGTAWANLNTSAWDIVKRWADSDGQLLSCASEIESALPPARQLLWRNVSDLGKSILDVQISFFAIEELLGEARKPVPTPAPGKEDPKSVFRRMTAVSFGKAKAYQDVLQYMPQEFKDAYMEKRFFEWKQDDVSFADEWPVYDDDDAEAGRNPWSNKLYYFNYWTDNGTIYIEAMSDDHEGHHEFLADAEVGTAEAARLEKDYGHEGWKQQMIAYWEWVRQHGEDPLNYIRTPMIEVKKEWIAGFVRQGDRLQLAALRQLTSQKPSPPAVPWPQVKEKVQADIAWKEALDYCLVNEDGITEAPEDEIIGEGGKWDKKGRLTLKFGIVSKEPAEGAREHIIAQAEDAIRELNAPA